MTMLIQVAAAHVSKARPGHARSDLKELIVLFWAVQANTSRDTQGLPALEFGVALHVGKVIYGNVGMQMRIDFTATGPAVGLAACIEGLPISWARLYWLRRTQEPTDSRACRVLSISNQTRRQMIASSKRCTSPEHTELLLVVVTFLPLLQLTIQFTQSGARFNSCTYIQFHGCLPHLVMVY